MKGQSALTICLYGFFHLSKLIQSVNAVVCQCNGLSARRAVLLQVLPNLRFVPVVVAYVVIDDFAFAVQDEHMRYRLHIHRAFESAVRVE